MIRKLRVKLAAIIMAFVTVILACVMAAVLGLTRATLEHESLDMKIPPELSEFFLCLL